MHDAEADIDVEAIVCHFFNKMDVSFCDILFAFLHSKSLLKWSLLYKELAPKGSPSLLEEGRQKHIHRVVSPVNVFPFSNFKEYFKGDFNPL